MDSEQCDSRSYVGSWLDGISDWVNPAELQNQQDQTLSLSSPGTITSPRSIYSFAGRDRARVSKRKRSMSTDEASNRSGETTRTAVSFQNRRILRPTPPSTRQGSSQSPTRKVLSRLKFATPSLQVCQPDVRLQQPPAVRRLRSMLITRLSEKLIPNCLETRLRAADPDQFEASAHLLEDPIVVYPALYTDALWQTTDKIYNEARDCYDNHVDESAWMKVVNYVLESSELGQNSSMLRVHSIQTQTIDPAFLPRHSSQSFAKKADLALAFSCRHPDVATALEPVYRANPDLALSQMTDAYTSTVPMVCCLEVKERGGDHNEAIVQLGIWCAAGLERLRGLWTLGGRDLQEEELPPFLGWTVVGHDWKFHLSWKDSDGNVVVLGPWRALSAGTGSHAEIFTLIALIRSVKQWLEEEYWTWLCSNVLNGLR